MSFYLLKMDAFLEFITIEEVTKVLINKRVVLADKRHKCHYKRNLSPGIYKRLAEPSHFVYSLMPPRRTWVTLNRNRRYRRSESAPKANQRISSMDYNREALRLTIMRDRRKNPCPDYLKRIEDFIINLRSRCMDSNYRIQPPQVFPKAKNSQTQEMRPICQFNDPYDSVIIILLNKFLTKALDRYFLPCSYAFRAPDKYGHMKSHHDSIAAVQTFMNKHKGAPLYVAECDMQKFYDTVDHRVVWDEFCHLISKLEQTAPLISYDSAKRLFRLYLDSYCFAQNVKILNSQPEYWIKHQCVKGAYFPWVNDSRVTSADYGVGVPQGGALSGLIANIVLNLVDRKLQKEVDKDVLYIRYCDDMIILSPKHQHSEWAFKVYKRAISKLKLVPHKALADMKFGRNTNCWKAKTRQTYKWDVGKDNAAEWIGFVGYEIKRTGEVRVRKTTLDKEINKQKKVFREDFREIFAQKSRVSNASLYQSIHSKLLAMSVGKVSLWNAEQYRNELCWISGFRNLNYNKYASRQMRQLDRMRQNTLKRVAAHLAQAVEVYKFDRPDLRDDLKDDGPPLRYYGKPFSYFYHYTRIATK